MGLFCSPDIFKALGPECFPCDKEGLLACAIRNQASEAAQIALNQLHDDTRFSNITDVCDNISIVCNLEVKRALEGLTFPATKEKILSQARANGATEMAMLALNELPRDYRFSSIDEICARVL